MSNKRMLTDCLSTHFNPKYLSCPKATWNLAVGTLVWSRHQTDLEWRDRLLRIFAEMFYQVKEFFRKAVDAIISLATPDRQGRHRDIFRNEEAAAIKVTMNEFADTESGRISIGKWLVDYASSKAALSDLDIHHAQGEVDGVAQGRYDWRVQRGGGLNIS